MVGEREDTPETPHESNKPTIKANPFRTRPGRILNIIKGFILVIDACCSHAVFALRSHLPPQHVLPCRTGHTIVERTILRKRRDELNNLAEHLVSTGTCVRSVPYLRRLARVGLDISTPATPLYFLNRSPNLTHETICVETPFPQPAQTHELTVSFSRKRKRGD